MTYHRPNLSNAYAVLAGATDNPVMNLYSYKKLTDGFFGAVFSSVESGKHYTFENYNNSVKALFDDRASIVEGSLFEIDSAHIPMYRAVLAISNKRIAMADAEKEGLTVVKANVFTDKSDNMWKLVGEGDSRELMQIGGLDDFAAILASKRERNRVTATVAEGVDFDDGDYGLFFNPVTAGIDYGFITKRQDGIYVLPRSSGKSIRILPECVLEAAWIEKVVSSNEDGSTKEVELAGPAAWRVSALAAGDFSIETYLNYQRSLFGGTAFFAALEKALRDSGIR